jgi:hypothetical protein
VTSTGTLVIAFIAAGIGLIALVALVRSANVPPFPWVRKMLDAPVGLPLPSREEPGAVYYRDYPRRLSLNWLALVLGPIWYLLTGLWVHASILITLVFLTGGLLAPVVWLYCGLKANEDLLEFRVARDSVY